MRLTKLHGKGGQESNTTKTESEMHRKCQGSSYAWLRNQKAANLKVAENVLTFIRQK